MPGKLLRRTWPHDPTADAPGGYKRACRYGAFVPDELSSLDVQFSADLAGVVSDAEQSIARLNAERAAALGPLARLLLRTESIASSKVEGLQLGVRELARAEAKAESGIRPASTAVEILANINAMTLAVEDAAEAKSFGTAQILAIHRRLFERAPNRHLAGRFRTVQNWIGGNDYNPCGADFVPPPPEELERLLDDLCACIDDERMPPLVQAALVHAQFETIHPFDDGNGRTGRALIHVVFRRRGIAPRFVPPISVIFARAKPRYITGLTEFRGRGVTGWIEYFAASTAHAARLATAYVAAVDVLQENWRDRLRAADRRPRADAAAWAVIDALPAHPMISAPVAAAAVDRTLPRVYEAIEQLVRAGILIPLSTGRRNRWWEAAGLLNLIARLESGDLRATGNSSPRPTL